MTDDELRALAKAATPGSWRAFFPSNREQVEKFANLICATAPRHQVRADNPGGSYPSADLRFIAATNPATVLALLNRVQRAEARIAALRAEIDGALDTTNHDKRRWRLYDALAADDKSAKESG